MKPISFIEWLATLVTPPGGVILDPFAGSGTTGVAARNKGFKVILCEREDEYVQDIRRRFESPSIVPDTHTHTHRRDDGYTDSSRTRNTEGPYDRTNRAQALDNC